MSTSLTRVCHRCGTLTEYWCPVCVEEIKNPTPVETMTPQERADELLSWYHILEVPFDDFHKRAEQLVGAPIFTHQFIHPEKLVERILND